MEFLAREQIEYKGQESFKKCSPKAEINIQEWNYIYQEDIAIGLDTKDGQKVV